MLRRVSPTRPSALVRVFWKIHPVVYRWSRGRLLGHLAGMDVLVLETRGRRSGAPRATCLTYFAPRDARDAFVVIGSFLGAPRDPAWVHNLRSDPVAHVDVRGRRLRVRAREAAGDERARLWSELVAIQPDYRRYEGLAARRTIPVVVLGPTR